MKGLKYTLCALALASTWANAADNRVGVSFYHYDNAFIQLMKNELAARAQTKGVQLLLNDAQNSQFVQNNQVEMLLDNKIKVLAVNLVDVNAYPTLIGKAKAKNVPIIFFNKDPGEKAIASYDKAFYVGANPEMSGQLQAQMIAKQWQAHPSWDLNGDGKMQYALLKGENFHPDAEIRTQSVVATLEKLGVKLDQLALESAQWRTDLAKEKVDSWLSTPHKAKIEVIIANNDAMAIGAAQAATSHGILIPIYGVDATPEAVNLIKLGTLAGTVRNNWQAQSQAILDLAQNLLHGKAATDGTNWQLEKRILHVPYVIVEKDKVQ